MRSTIIFSAILLGGCSIRIEDRGFILESGDAIYSTETSSTQTNQSYDDATPYHLGFWDGLAGIIDPANLEAIAKILSSSANPISLPTPTRP